MKDKMSWPISSGVWPAVTWQINFTWALVHETFWNPPEKWMALLVLLNSATIPHVDNILPAMSTSETNYSHHTGRRWDTFLTSWSSSTNKHRKAITLPAAVQPFGPAWAESPSLINFGRPQCFRGKGRLWFRSKVCRASDRSPASKLSRIPEWDPASCELKGHELSLPESVCM